MLVHNKTLTRLNLRHNGVGDEGARALAKSLCTGKVGVTELDLSSNNIGQKGGVALAKSLLRAPSLALLNLESNQLPADALALLRAAASAVADRCTHASGAASDPCARVPAAARSGSDVHGDGAGNSLVVPWTFDLRLAWNCDELGTPEALEWVRGELAKGEAVFDKRLRLLPLGDDVMMR